ncbi:MAG: Hg(II)-responsive transcriptional regulator [Sulfuricellaceae bacterium]|nr:Hg(II)-responsive transcriptional regulator [Sulfuricellaceae bacterium]
MAITIGALAQAAGVNVETIRYYQRRGLLAEPDKPLQGFRHYTLETVERVRFIKRAQKLGFTLEDVANLLQLNDGVHCAEARSLAANKLAAIEAKIADLEGMRRMLAGLIQQCQDGNRQEHCPIIATLSGQVDS